MGSQSSPLKVGEAVPLCSTALGVRLLICMCDVSSSLIWFQESRLSFFFFLNLPCFQKETLSGFCSLTSVDSNSSAGVSLFCLSSPKLCVKKGLLDFENISLAKPVFQRNRYLSHLRLVSVACAASAVFMNILSAMEAMHNESSPHPPPHQMSAKLHCRASAFKDRVPLFYCTLDDGCAD